MRKILTSAVALTFIAGMGLSTISVADKHGNEALMKACKGKKAGDKVKVDGKEMKCPKMEDKGKK